MHPLKHRASLAWRDHREELIPWGVGLVVYTLFMWPAEPSKYTRGMAMFLLLWPIIFALRMARTIAYPRAETPPADRTETPLSARATPPPNRPPAPPR